MAHAAWVVGAWETKVPPAQVAPPPWSAGSPVLPLSALRFVGSCKSNAGPSPWQRSGIYLIASTPFERDYLLASSLRRWWFGSSISLLGLGSVMSERLIGDTVSCCLHQGDADYIPWALYCACAHCCSARGASRRGYRCFFSNVLLVSCWKKYRREERRREEISFIVYLSIRIRLKTRGGNQPIV